MQWKATLPILCILLLSSIAIAGCTFSLNPFNSLNPSNVLTSNASGSVSGISALGTTNGTAHMLAVEQTDSSQYIGAISDVIVYTQSGSGHVFVETAPLTGVDFQQTARDAVQVAAESANINPNQRDFEFVLHVPSGVDAVDGPSAGLPMTIATYSAITKKSTNPNVYATGAIDSSGTISDVSGVYLKALAAAQSGAKVILVPSDETVVSTTNPLASTVVAGVNLQQQLKSDGYNVTVVGVNNFDDALPYYFS